MHEPCAFERVVVAFMAQVASRQLAQLVIDQGQQLIERGSVALRPVLQQLRDGTRWRGGGVVDGRHHLMWRRA
jgi:hypothetical protein